MSVPRVVPGAGAAQARGAVVVIDTLRAFTTAAYAFASGANRIVLVREVAAAHRLKIETPELLLAGEQGGLRLPGFDFANSPAQLERASLDGRDLALRTSAGTRGAVEAVNATRRWCATLVCASATAAAVAASGLGQPTYVATGWSGHTGDGNDDVLTAELIERARCGEPLQTERTAAAVAASDEARVTLALGEGNVDPRDVELSCRVDVFDFAMEAVTVDNLVQLRRVV